MTPRKLKAKLNIEFMDMKHGFRVVVQGGDTNGQLSILDQGYSQGETVLSQGETVLPHKHTRESHLVQVLDGRFRFDFHDSSMDLGPTELINIPHGVWHGFTALEEHNTLRIYLYPAGLEQLFLALEKEPGLEQAHVDALIGEYGIKRDRDLLLGDGKS